MSFSGVENLDRGIGMANVWLADTTAGAFTGPPVGGGR